MGVCAGIDHNAVDGAAQRVDAVDHLPLAIMLREPQLRADLGRDGAEGAFDVVERFSSVESWFARAQEIQIRSIDDRDSHVFFSPLSQVLNCAMSSAPWPGLVCGSVLDSTDPSVRSSAKNRSKEKASPADVDVECVAASSDVGSVTLNASTAASADSRWSATSDGGTSEPKSSSIDAICATGVGTLRCSSD